MSNEIEVEDLKRQLQIFRDAERSLSQAYLRLRSKLGAFDTPEAPSAAQVWAHTEERLDELFLIMSEINMKIRNFAYDKPDAQLVLIPLCDRITRFQLQVKKYNP